MSRMTVVTFRDNLSDALNRVAYQGDRIVLERRGKDVAVLIPVEEFVVKYPHGSAT